MHILNPVTDEFWWDVARNCSYATFYHTPLWREIAIRTFPGRYKNETIGAVLPNGVRVVLPMLSHRRIGPLRWLHSTFENCYGGLIADGPVTEAEAMAIYEQAFDWSTYTFYLIDHPIGPPLNQTLRDRMTHVYSEPTYLLHLDTDFETILGRFSRSRRTAYRSGLRKGVQTRVATSLDEVRAYYASYRDAIERWGEDDHYGYSWELFEQIYYLSQEYPEQIKIWLMVVDDQIAGGRLILYWNTHASLWHGSAHRDFLGYDVMPVGDTEIIRDAIEHGYHYFDFNTSGQKAGVMTYKERFGSEMKSVNMWRYENPILKPIQQWYWMATGK
ncbi:GNAT family N-acetyltransferase [Candidatus Oscillochloris fontis]|uniref:GNAT family N-acetyltransferase n=1 Tax=Candidatus Oscillochloris fontis TaxID=2496868 RepID=UPI00101B70EF|nr:GNAT family N-acetyltransferase [Candidatus Oscillochloris fontis]